MTSIAGIDRLFEAHLIVADLDASIAFYRDRLGLELAHVVPERRAAFFWVGARGDSMLGLWQGGAGPQKRPRTLPLPQRLRTCSQLRGDCSRRASLLSTSTGDQQRNRLCSPGCRRRPCIFSTPMVTSWSTSRCSTVNRAPTMVS